TRACLATKWWRSCRSKSSVFRRAIIRHLTPSCLAPYNRRHEIQRTPCPVPNRRRLQSLLGRASLAEWRHLPALRQRESVGGQIPPLPLAVQGLQQERLSVLRHHRNDLREHQVPAAGVVQG